MKNIIIKILRGLFAALAWVGRCPLMRIDRIAHMFVCFFGSAIFGYGFGIGAGIAAEYKDRAWGGRWDWWDIAADGVGALLGELVHYAIFKNW